MCLGPYDETPKSADKARAWQERSCVGCKTHGSTMDLSIIACLTRMYGVLTGCKLQLEANAVFGQQTQLCQTWVAETLMPELVQELGLGG
jgi:hypothetical protein